jgi:hypothetical protein
MTFDGVTVAIILGLCNLLVAPFVGYIFRFGKALETRQIADNAAREKEITALGHKMELAAQRVENSQQLSHRDMTELKEKVNGLTTLLSPLIDRLGLHIPATMEHR